MGSGKSPLDGQVAIVTGANRVGGIGASTAFVLAKSGARVIIAGRNLDELNHVSEGFQERGFLVESCYLDLKSATTIEQAIASVQESWGRLDILVNNAAENGLPGDSDVVALDVDAWDTIFATNARGTMLLSKYAIPLMIHTGGGSIVTIGSGYAREAHNKNTAYACSKAAIATLSNYIALQFGSEGIRCNTIIPGVIETEGSSQMPHEIAEAYKDNCSLKRLGKPIDIANLVAFLVREESSYITGQEIIIDGGFSRHVPMSIMEIEDDEFSD